MNARQTNKFYSSRAWKSVREQMMVRDQGLCVICRRAGELTPAVEVDHIIPIKEDISRGLDPANLQCLCKRCHRNKTLSDYSKTPRICIHGDFEYRCEKCKA